MLKRWTKRLAGVISLAFAACQSSPEDTAPQSTLETREATRIAGQMQFRNPDIHATIGQGSSMQPVYTEDTVILIHPIEYHDLDEDMIVAYRDEDGRIVIHRLVRFDINGWVAQGINNPREDRERVTEDNLLGVVYTVIYTRGQQVE